MDAAFAHISPFAPGGRALNVIVETPRTSRCKFRHDPETGLFRLGFFLPTGLAFPYDFGFVPSTCAEDGDPLDVLILMDEPTFPGCLVVARPIGVIEARQTERGRSFRNDRVLAIASESRVHAHVRTLRDVGARALGDLEDFFVAYNAARGKTFAPLARRGARAAIAHVRSAARRAP